MFLLRPRKKARLARVLALALASVARVVAAPSETERGLPPITRFKPEAYRGVSWVSSVAVTPTGLVVLGSSYKVIVYDGHTFEHIAMPSVFVTQAVCDASGRIWVAGENEFGTIEPDAATGALHYTSHLTDLPPDQRVVGTTSGLVPWHDGVCVLSGTALITLTSQGVRVWPLPADPTSTLHAAGGRLYIHRMSDGLTVFDGEKLTPLESGLSLVKKRTVVLPGDEQRALVFVAGLGAHWLNYATGQLTHFAISLDPLFAESAVRDGTRLSDGRYVLQRQGSGGGIVIAEADLSAGTLIDGSAGVTVQSYGTFCADSDRGLWIGTGSGLLRFDLSPGLSVFDERNGIDPANGGQFVRHEGTLYRASGTGLFRLEPGQPALGKPAHWVVDPRYKTPCSDVLSTPAGLMITGNIGVDWLDGSTVRHLAEAYCNNFQMLRHHPGTWVCGSDRGLHVFTLRDNQPTLIARLAPDQEIWNTVENDDGSLWCASPFAGIFHITSSADDDWTHAKVEHFPPGQAGLPNTHGWSAPYRSLSGVSFMADDGTHRFDAATRTFPIDERYSAEGVTALRNFPAELDDHGRLWTSLWSGVSGCVSPLGYFAADAPNQFRWHPAPAHVQEAVGYWGAGRILREGEIFWASSTTSVVRLDLVQPPDPAPAAHWKPIFRAITTDQNQLSLSATAPRLGYSRAPMVFRFAAPRHYPGANVRYETRLVGYRDEWSAPTNEPQAVFTGLIGGPFTFEVRARDARGQISEVAQYTFSVAPPWHRSPLAFALYALAGLAAVFAYVRWRLGRAAREQRRLEGLVVERTRDLATARDQAEAASRAKSSFLAAMSHELRTPLNGVIGYAQILQGDRRLAADQQERLRIVQSSGEHLLHMINDVLDLAKIEAGKLELRPAPFLLGEMLKDVAAAHAPTAAAKGLVFSTDVATDLPGWVEGDAQKLRQVLDNLLGNAVKFTSTGQVVLRVRRSAHADEPVEFSVIDTGPGIAPTDQVKLFQPFEQARASRPNATGTGLGLAISRAIVERMGGSLQVTSALGAGSTFSFDLTLPSATPAATRVLAPVTGYEGTPRHVLIVDDHAVNRQLLADLLGPLGFVCVSYESGLAALRDLAAGATPWPDLAIIDVRMDDIDGIELTRRLRAQPRGASLRILLTSASVLTFNPEDGRRAGCDDFLPKPFRTADLVEKIGQLLQLTWRTAPAAKTPTASASPFPRGSLPVDVRETLREALAQGDLVAFRRHVETARAAHPAAAPMLDELDAAAAAFQLSRLRQLLEATS